MPHLYSYGRHCSPGCLKCKALDDEQDEYFNFMRMAARYPHHEHQIPGAGEMSVPPTFAVVPYPELPRS